ncbi:MAG TPA: DoxX family protein [Labilithrix sp.]|nr:DoxX family protein [Labilithrix sp.]
MATITSNEAARGVDAPKSWKLWVGRALSGLPVALMLLSGVLKLTHAPDFVAMWTGKLGWTEGKLTSIGLLELACLALYVVPRTAGLGAVLLTAYLGGAVAAHVRIDEPFFIPVVLGVLVWGGLYLRDDHVRSLLPQRTA